MFHNICFLFSLIIAFLACNSSSSFLGSGSRKSTKATSEKSEIVVEETENPVQENEPLEPVQEEEAYQPDCFMEPISFSEETIQFKEIFNWQKEQVLSTPVIGKIIDDTPSIVFTSHSDPSYVYAIKGSTGTDQWKSEIESDGYSSPAIGDIDLDGKNEVIISGVDRYLYALQGNSGKVLWKNSINLPEVRYWAFGVSLFDLNNDGKVEVILRNNIFDAKNGQFKFSVLGDETGETLAGDVNDEPGVEVITPVGIFKGTDGTQLCQFPTSIGGIAFAKMKKDDGFFTIIGRAGCPANFDCRNSTNTQLIGYNGQTCQELFKTSIPGGAGGPSTIADLDGDGDLEIGIAGRSFYITFKGDGTEIWKYPTTDYTSGATGSTTFDFNGDGAVEIVYNDEQNLRIFEGKTGRVIYQIANSSATHVEYPVVADIDGDGHANIIVSANPYSGQDVTGIRVFSAPQNNWIGTREIWNQFGYNVTNVSDKGDIVNYNKDSIWKKWIPNEYLLGYRNNLPKRLLKENCQK